VKMTETDSYTPPQAARILGLSRRRVTQMLNEGGLEGEKLANGRWKVPSSAVAAFLEARGKQPAPPTGKRQADKMVVERRIERLTDSLSRLFTRLERLEDKVRELDEDLTREPR
jgi:excisionase family DNA binding protein